MELEAENLWIHSASHDFHDKTNSSKNIIFSCRKFFSSKIVQLFQKYFQNGKIIEKSIHNF